MVAGAQSPENQLAPKIMVVNIDQEFKKWFLSILLKKNIDDRYRTSIL